MNDCHSVMFLCVPTAIYALFNRHTSRSTRNVKIKHNAMFGQDYLKFDGLASVESTKADRSIVAVFVASE